MITLYHIVPKDNTCVCMCLDYASMFIRVNKDTLNDFLKKHNGNVEHLSFKSEKSAQDYLNRNFAYPESYMIEEYYIEE